MKRRIPQTTGNSKQKKTPHPKTKTGAGEMAQQVEHLSHNVTKTASPEPKEKSRERTDCAQLSPDLQTSPHSWRHERDHCHK